MKNYKEYFERTGRLYGVSSKFEFGWEHSVRVFTDLETAEAWLHTEQYDFRERELMSRTAAEKLCGRKAVREVA